MTSTSIARSALPNSPLERARAGLDLCVHCGFCLQACPTYLALDDENDSPRGRLVLMRGLLEGDLAPTDPEVGTHIDRCLGCRGCESACPSGVPYGQLLEATRATLARHRPIPFIARLILGVFQHPALLRLALTLTRWLRSSGLTRLLARLPGRVGFPFAMIEATRPVFAGSTFESSAPPDGPTCTLLRGCVMEGLFAHTNRATERVLRVNGYAATAAPGQGCCGALHAHAGDDAGARTLARRNIEVFEQSPADFIVANSSGCGAMMREYGHLLADDPTWSERARQVAARVRDVSELLAARGPRPGAPLALRVTADAPCHLQHAQRLVTPPRAVLSAIPHLEVVPLKDSDQCCGGAGIYNLVEPDVSERVLAPKVYNIRATGAQLVVTGNPGCLMQIGAGLIQAEVDARVVHPVDLLDASYAARDLSGDP